MTDLPALRYDPIAVTSESTVVAELDLDTSRSTAYQSEAQLEEAFIQQLVAQAYERLVITSEADLIANLRARLERLNDIRFSDEEWARFYRDELARESDGILEKTARIQESERIAFRRDDRTTRNVTLIDKRSIHNNTLQVINQYESEGAHATRYDVTILVNGLPLVHVELKRRGVPIREAFNQIQRYQRDSFWAGTGLFQYVQLFVISNGTQTKYYSNTTRERHIAESAQGPARRGRRTSNSFEFTSWWATESNRPIEDLVDFTKTFFAKHTILNVLTRYCVFDTDRTLLVMRPYQIVATEKILQRIVTSTNARQLGRVDAGGYIWHTTGSGKTLTSFKTAQLASRMPEVDNVLFVVDRKDLDYQTMKEYNRFEEGAANGNTSTAVLARQLSDPSARIIVTTIQKLSRFVERHKQHPIYSQHVVAIFDECHRSQFGDMHVEITKAFKRYHLFGFTGTPIFAANSASGGKVHLRTTEQAFGDKLHTYTILDAIRDRNVLPFRIDYVDTVKAPAGMLDKQVRAIDTEAALGSQERIRGIAQYILEHFDQKTQRRDSYEFRDRRVSGFNALFATSSIEHARRYYTAFAQLQDELQVPAARRLKVAVVYSWAPNEAEPDGLLPDESMDAEKLDAVSRDFLDDAIYDYNDLFHTNFSTSGDGFQRYYVDLTQRIKSREVDLTIVVDMLLTGFDATTLNTLFVDKNLRQHGLIQAFSRTNRILNSVKTYGNIVAFRDLDQATNDAIALFGDKDAHGIVVLKPYGEYHADYADLVDRLTTEFPPGTMPVGDDAENAFIALFGDILRLRNILLSFDEFAGDALLPDGMLQDYQSRYVDLWAERRERQKPDRESIADDVVFEIELVKSVEVDIDYILMLVQKYSDQLGDDKEIAATITRAIDSSITLRSKKDLIEAFVDSVGVKADVDDDWRTYIAGRKQAELDAIIDGEGLKPDETRALLDAAFRDGALQSAGTTIARILPPMPRFGSGAAARYIAKRASVLDALARYFDRFSGLS
ncbi:type I restriction endonuclease subunit R [Schumannella sp. 10F1B-5-1]|uniref:type I restriction endonuclease subunit R n=1 Tax=Schumannella sp. 10F1B-5-1 TaxID=2590780 RepID=UPI001130430A|nr:type I restriction endonuclease subunit R [Schumannella sp. 10F1B-5-1]TPW76995.1 type I restriction endonuclease subunit R [Schumannella sp. 10F1B-5-1]